MIQGIIIFIAVLSANLISHLIITKKPGLFKIAIDKINECRRSKTVFISPAQRDKVKEFYNGL